MNIELLKNKITELVLKSPDKAAVILSDWVNGRSDPDPSSISPSTPLSKNSLPLSKKAGASSKK